MKRSLTLATALSLFVADTTQAQNLTPPPLEEVAGSARVDGKLFEMVRNIPQGQRGRLTAALRAELRARAKVLRWKVRDDDKIFVEIIGPADGQIDRDLKLPDLEALGIEIGLPAAGPLAPPRAQVHIPLTRSATRAEAWLPLAAIKRIETLLPQGWRVIPIRPVELDLVVGEGPARTNSNTYQSAGANGAGLTIAVIDGGYSGLTAARNNGDAPVAAQINLTTNPSFEDGTVTHGTGCVEAAFDHAPGAAWRLYRIDSPADYNAVITDCIANNVNIISHSLSQYNLGWGDNTGAACVEANRAGQNNILFFTSCGNRADSHYEGAFTDADGDGFHEFAPGDETIDVTIAMGAAAGGSHYLSWSNPASDFDFYLYDNTTTNVVASATTNSAGAFETFSYTNPGASATFHLAVRRRAGSASSVIEIFSHNSATWNEHAVASGSNTSPSNATDPHVITVGAVTEASYGSAAGSNVIASYSSLGPSNSGMTLPDLCGPTDTIGFTYPTGFGGTSCATPNAAGAAAAFWSADLNLNAPGIAWLLSTQAGILRDWGPAGFENTYGAGGLQLVTHRAGTRWLARNYPGVVDDGTVPFHTIVNAYLQVPNGGRLLILGANFGTFPEAVQLGDIPKTFDLQVMPGTPPAILGQ